MIQGKVAVYLCLHALTTKLDHIFMLFLGGVILLYELTDDNIN